MSKKTKIEKEQDQENKGYISEVVISIMIEYCNMMGIEIPCFAGKKFTGLYSSCGDIDDRNKTKRIQTKELLNELFDYYGHVLSQEEMIDVMQKYMIDKNRKNGYIQLLIDKYKLSPTDSKFKADLNMYGKAVSVKCMGGDDKLGDDWTECFYTIVNKSEAHNFFVDEIFDRNNNKHIALVDRMRNINELVIKYPFIKNKDYKIKIKKFLDKLIQYILEDNVNVQRMYNVRKKQYGKMYYEDEHLKNIIPILHYFTAYGSIMGELFNIADSVLVCSNPADYNTYIFYDDITDYLKSILPFLSFEFRSAHKSNNIYVGGECISLEDKDNKELLNYACVKLKNKLRNYFAIHVDIKKTIRKKKIVLEKKIIV